MCTCVYEAFEIFVPTLNVKEFLGGDQTSCH